MSAQRHQENEHEQDSRTAEHHRSAKRFVPVHLRDIEVAVDWSGPTEATCFVETHSD
jgi:hypothetical protein